MDFMDDDMKAIARKGFWSDERTGGWYGVYAACEAVLAEEKRQKQAWDGYPPLEEAPKEMDATMADEVRHPAQQASLGELTPDELSRFRQRLNIPAELVRQQPADDVVKKVAIAIAQEDRYGPADADWTGSTGKVYLAQAAAALAVAREGMVPASELEKAKAGWNHALNRWDEENCKRNALIDEVATLKQQLSSMYSLEQVEKAIFAELKQHNHLWSNTLFWEAVRARLTAKPTEREPAKWVNISYRVDVMGSTCVVCGAVISDQLAHTEWHNNFMNFIDALGKGGK